MKILIVDDEENILKIVKACLDSKPECSEPSTRSLAESRNHPAGSHRPEHHAAGYFPVLRSAEE